MHVPLVHARRAFALLAVATLGCGGIVAFASTTPAAAAGTVILVQHPTGQTTADFPPNTDFTVPWTVTPTAGDTFLVAASNYCTTSTTTPALTSNPGGWTLVNHALGTSEGGFMWGKLMLWRWTGASVPGNVVMQMQGGTPSCDMSVAAFEYQGLQPDPVDVNVQSSFNGTASSWVLPTVTTTQDNELLFVAEANRSSAAPVTSVTPGFTLESNKISTGGTSNMGLSVADRTAATAGAYSPTIAFCAGCGSHPGAISLGLKIAPTSATAPIISGVGVSGVTSTAATVNWTTDQPATSRVVYGLSAIYDNATALDATNVTTHSQTLSGLSPSTTYHFAAVSSTAGGSVTTNDATFVTAAPGKSTQTINFGALSSATLAQSTVSVAATATSALVVVFTSRTPSVCTAGGASGSVIALSALGTCTVQADQPGDASFNPAPPVQQSFTVVDSSQIAYPDLVGVIPTGGLAISHPTTTTKEFDYTHIIYNEGQGPLELQPTNYNATTNLATAVQQLYAYNGSTPVLAEQVAARDQFFFHVAHGHYHFPLATFGLYSVNPDGSIGNAVAMSPKNGFCLGDDSRLDTSLPHSPVTKNYDGTTCTNPLAVRGIDSGWGDKYDKADPGQAIDITGLPDGVYWFHSVVDPDNNFLESDKTNNDTDIKVRISGDTVTPVSPVMSQGAFVIDQSFLVDGTGALSTPAFNTTAPNELLVALTSAFSQNPPLTSTVSGGGLTWTLAKRANGQAGGVDVWTAAAPTPLTNAVITANPSWTLRTNSLTVFAIKGAAGIGATAALSGAASVPSLSLTTTQPGSWVMAVANDPTSYAPHQIGAGKTMVHQLLDGTQRNGEWVQATSAPVPAAGTAVSFADAMPLHDAWNEVAVEITPAASADITPPVISAVSANAPAPTSANITWTTDEPATSRVDYGFDPSFGQSTSNDATLVTQHGRSVIGLTPSTTYSYQVVSTDAAGNVATSGPFAFVTAPPRTTPPLFTNVKVVDLQSDQATLSWTTDEPAASAVDYGITTSYAHTSATDPNLVTTHFVLVTNLSPATVYHYRVDGTDAFGNSGSSDDFTFQTLAPAPPVTVERSVSQDGTGSVTTPAFNTAGAGDLLVAFVAADGTAGIPQASTVSGAGLTWSLDERANTQNGTAEIWHAFASGPLTGATVTSTPGTAAAQSLTVVVFAGARGVGATDSLNASIGAPNVTLSMTGSNSLVYAVGNDWDHATARTPALGQSLVHQFLDSASAGTYWTQALNGTGGPVESDITMADSAPTADRWNFAAVEIQRPIGVAPPPPTAPALSAIGASSADPTSETVTWTTDQVSTSQVAYGPDAGYGNTTTRDLTPVVAHSQTLTGLAPTTQYHFAVTSENGAGVTTSPDLVFTTSAIPAPVDQSITFPPMADAALAASPVAVGATASSGLAVVFSSTTPLVCSVAGTAVALLAPGSCTIQADQGGNAAYNAAPPVQQTFTVLASKLDQTITFPPIVDVTLLQSPVLIGATASSGLPVTFSSATPAVCTVATGSITLLTAGPCTIRADQSGSAIYNAAPPVQQGFAVTKATQLITFGALANKSLGQTPVSLTGVATASSGLTVALSSATPLVCTVSGTNANLLTTGTCTIRADQAGNATYSAAPPMQQSFVVSAPFGISIETSIFKDGKGTQTTAAFSTTTPGDVLVAFVAADGPTTGQTATVSGAGLTWTLVKRTNVRPGTSEVWRAIAPTALTNVTVTSTLAVSPTTQDQTVTVVAFRGASGVGASSSANAATGAPTVGLTTTKAASWVFAVGNDWDHATARTVGGGQAIVHQFVDSAIGDTYWVQSATAPTAASGTLVTMSDTAPTNDRWNFTAVEVQAT